MYVLLNGTNNGFPNGQLELLEDGESRIRWLQKVDFARALPAGRSIENIVGLGWGEVSFFADVIAAVARTKATARKAFKALNFSMNGHRDSNNE